MKRTTLGALAGLLVGVVVVLVLTVLVRTWGLVDAIRETQKVNTGTLQAAENTLEIVKDCTTPGGECKLRGEKDTGNAINLIALKDLLSDVCADQPGPQNRAEVQSCVDRYLTRMEVG